MRQISHLFYKEIIVGENTFILVHAGTGNFGQDKELWDYNHKYINEMNHMS